MKITLEYLENFSLITSLNNGDDPFERVAQKALEPYPDAVDFANWIITHQLPKGRPLRFGGFNTVTPYRPDMHGIGDYIDDLFIQFKRWVLLVDGGAETRPTVKPYDFDNSKTKRGVVDSLYAQWKHLNKDNAGVPSEF